MLLHTGIHALYKTTLNKKLSIHAIASVILFAIGHNLYLSVWDVCAPELNYKKWDDKLHVHVHESQHESKVWCKKNGTFNVDVRAQALIIGQTVTLTVPGACFELLYFCLFSFDTEAGSCCSWVKIVQEIRSCKKWDYPLNYWKNVG